MSFINWGETPEQREAMRRLEQDALFEQAMRIRLSKSAAVASGGGSLDDGYIQPGYVIAGYFQQNNDE